MHVILCMCIVSFCFIEFYLTIVFNEAAEKSDVKQSSAVLAAPVQYRIFCLGKLLAKLAIL